MRETCYDCLYLKAKIPVKNGRLLYNKAIAYCKKDNLTKGDVLARRYYYHVIPEKTKKTFEIAERCQDFEDMRDG